MPSLESPFPHIAEATDAATKILALQADLFLLNQELKTLRQIKRAIWLGVGFILLNLLLTLTFFWIEMGLHENGWSSFSLALLTLVFFGILAAASALMALRVGQV